MAGENTASRRVARVVYDFAVDGGAVGNITLRGDSVPQSAIITDVLVRVLTVPTSGGGATIALSSEGAGDLQAAAAISGAPWSTTGPKRCTLNATGTPILTTAQRSIVAVVATAALTAGKFVAYVSYLVEPTA